MNHLIAPVSTYADFSLGIVYATCTGDVSIGVKVNVGIGVDIDVNVNIITIIVVAS